MKIFAINQCNMIEVSNLPPGGNSRDTIISYFSNSKHGGSTVKYVLYPDDGDNSKAIVVFEEGQEAVQKIITHPDVHKHSINDTPVSVRPIIFSSVYSQCTACVSPIVAASIPDRAGLLERLKVDFGLQAKDESNGAIQLIGDLIQLQSAQLYIGNIFREQQALQMRQFTRLPVDTGSKLGGATSKFGLDTGDTYFEESLAQSMGKFNEVLHDRGGLARTLDENGLSRRREEAAFSGSMPAMHLSNGLDVSHSRGGTPRSHLSNQEHSSEMPVYGSGGDKSINVDGINDTGFSSPRRESPFESSDRMVDEIFGNSRSTARSHGSDSSRSETSERVKSSTPRSAKMDVKQYGAHSLENDEVESENKDPHALSSERETALSRSFPERSGLAFVTDQNGAISRSSTEIGRDTRSSLGTMSAREVSRSKSNEASNMSNTAPVIAWDDRREADGNNAFLSQSHPTHMFARTDRDYRSLDFDLGQTGLSTQTSSHGVLDSTEYEELQQSLGRSGIGASSAGTFANHIDASITSTYDTPTESVELDSNVLEYMKKVQADDLQNLEKKHGIKLLFGKEGDIATVSIIPSGKEEIGDHYGINIKLGKDELVSMYQTVFYVVVKEDLSVEPTEEKLKAFGEAIHRVKQTYNSKMIIEQEANNHVAMIGPKNQVMVAKNHILESVNVVDSTPRSSPGHSPLSPREHDIPSGEKPKMMYVLHQGPGKSSEPTASKRIKNNKSILPSKPQIRQKSTTGSSKSSDVGSSTSSHKSAVSRTSTQQPGSRVGNNQQSNDLVPRSRSSDKNTGSGVKRSSSISRISTEKLSSTDFSGRTDRTVPSPSPRRKSADLTDTDHHNHRSRDSQRSVPQASPRTRGQSPRPRSSSETRSARESSRSQTTAERLRASLEGSQVDVSGSLKFRTPEGINVVCCQADITKQSCDVIVNAARGSLHHIGGVAGAISDAAGPKFQQDSIKYVAKYGHLRDSDVTHQQASGRLRCLWVVHAVGPMWVLYPNKNECADVLKMAVLNALNYADTKLKAHHIALPCISSGIFGVPIDVCAQSMYRAIRQFSVSPSRKKHLKEIRVVNTEQEITAVMSTIFQQLLEQDAATETLGTGPGSQKVMENALHSSTASYHFPGGSTNEGSTEKYSGSGRMNRSSQSNSRSSTPREVNDQNVFLSDSGKFSFGGRPKDRFTGLNGDEDDLTVPKSVYGSSQFGSHDFKLNHDLDGSFTQNLVGSLGLTAEERKLNGLGSYDYETVSNSQILSAKSDSTPSSRRGSQGQSTRESYEMASHHQTCPICLEKIKSPKTLEKCGHTFCTECIEDYFHQGKPVCPSCGMIYGPIKGDQPKGGRMLWEVSRATRLAGYEDHGSIIITYEVPSGKQGERHPTPGASYKGIKRRCYLPNNTEGREVLRMLKFAFDAGLTFTISDSRTTGKTGVVTWNDIHHKTSIDGGPTKFGYPDPTYLQRVKEELAAKGITSEVLPTGKKD